MQADLSIVILVYKTAQLLERCLDSLVESKGYDAKRVEIVVVSDASPDNCDEVIAEYRTAHPEIVYVKRDRNGGEAQARNTGLQRCSGRYYTYVDSDDTVTEGYLTRIIDVIDKDAPDIITYQYHLCDPKGCHLSGSNGGFEGVLSIHGSSEDRRRIFARFSMSLRCNAVIRREMMSGVAYEENYKLGVDALFAFEAFLRGTKFAWISDILYNYYQYNESATHNFDERRISDLLKVHEYYIKRIEELPYYSEVADLVFGFFHMNYLTWILDQAINFGDQSPVALQLRSLYSHVLQRAREAEVISGIKYLMLMSIVKRENLKSWLNLKRIYKVETFVNRVKCLTRRILHVR